MNRLTLSGLCMAAALMTSHAFAADDLCAANLQKIDDADKTAGSVSAQIMEQNKEDIEKAKAAQASGDKKTCIALSERVWQSIDKATNSDSKGQ
ncbi:hypothetical protein PMM47T1_23999 [Pseudomonas sp. M47T1]|uniref:hypothetical protein n=1 Tax=unclassified Pseudomonas TaxID=196821 RepID=UPI00026068F2|nr:hypothetical protein [Pseudomonas sp. M47T1]EIK94012.1 hypothetical protein PMM47T1_23999 [Pseudomonas sp. M47T1]